MSNTLPRTKSNASSLSTTSTIGKERTRPISLCETSWNQVVSPTSATLYKSHSQANNLCTTVPVSIVSQKLGGRHAPTKNSLRHSRLANKGRTVMVHDRRWLPRGLSRVGTLVIMAQSIVGVMGLSLAVWLVFWAPSIPFREVPHYACLPVTASSIIGSFLICCCKKRKRRICGNALKILLAALCFMSIIACISVCIFTALHLIYLAPMRCFMNYEIKRVDVSFASPQNKRTDIQTDVRDMSYYSDYYEGSGSNYDLHVDEEYDYFDNRFPPAVSVSVIPKLPEGSVELNVSSCVCESRGPHWRRVLRYPELNCLQVKNILPILFVASCVITVVAAILSCVIMYLIWMSRNQYYLYARPHELRPIVHRAENSSSVITSKIQPMIR